MKILKFVPLFALAWMMTAAAAHFDFKDWEIACDNTRRCEAAGYQSEASDSQPVVLSLAREAGAAAAVKVKLSVSLEDDDKIGPLAIQVGKLTLGGLTADGYLNDEQAGRLLPQLLNANAAAVTDGKHQWRLSLSGLKAALLKMDDLQGRVDTTTALAKPGGKPAASVPPPLPPPTVRKVAPPIARKGEEKLIAAMVKNLHDEGCGDAEYLLGEGGDNTIYRLPGSQMLLMLECGRGAYQSWYRLWSVNDKPPYAATPVQLPDARGVLQRDVMGASLYEGKLSSFGKGRGLGDCGYSAAWVWTAAGFQLVEASRSILCRGIAGGYALGEWVAKVVE